LFEKSDKLRERLLGELLIRKTATEIFEVCALLGSADGDVTARETRKNFAALSRFAKEVSSTTGPDAPNLTPLVANPGMFGQERPRQGFKFGIRIQCLQHDA
jgi:hypothetical protein